MSNTVTLSALAITSSISTTPSFSVEGFAKGMLYLDAKGTNTTSLAFHSCATREGTYHPVYSGTTAQAIAPTASRNYPLPSTVFGANFIKILADHADGATVSISILEKE